MGLYMAVGSLFFAESPDGIHVQFLHSVLLMGSENGTPFGNRLLPIMCWVSPDRLNPDGVKHLL